MGIILFVIACALDIYLIYLCLYNTYRINFPKKLSYKEEVEEFHRHMEFLGINEYDITAQLMSYTFKELKEANRRLRKINKNEKV